MIEVRFNGSASEVRAEMRDFLGLDAEAAPEPVKLAEDKPKATRGKSKAEPATTEPAVPTADASSTVATSETTASSATTSPSDITRETVAPLCQQYGTKAGAPALQALFRELGAANGKFSEVPADKYGALKARLDELLSA